MTWDELKAKLLKPVLALEDHRTKYAFINDGIILIGELYTKSIKDHLHTSNFGKKGVDIVRSYLEREGLSPLLAQTPLISDDHQQIGYSLRYDGKLGAHVVKKYESDPTEEKRLRASIKYLSILPHEGFKIPRQSSHGEHLEQYRAAFSELLDANRDNVIALTFPGGHDAFLPSQVDDITQQKIREAFEEVAAIMCDVGGISPSALEFAKAVSSSDPNVKAKIATIMRRVFGQECNNE